MIRGHQITRIDSPVGGQEKPLDVDPTTGPRASDYPVVSWSGYIKPATTGSYTFDLGGRSFSVQIEGQSARAYEPPYWPGYGAQFAGWNTTTPITLTAGQKYKIRAFSHFDTPVTPALTWALNSGAPQPVPASALEPAILPAPKTPDGVKVSSVTPGVNTITWNAQTGQKGFVVYRLNSYSSPNFITSPNFSIGPSATSYTDTTAPSTGQVYYCVKSVYDNLPKADDTFSSPSFPSRNGTLTSEGTDFWFAYPKNTAFNPHTTKVYITSKLGASGTLSLPRTSLAPISFSVPAGGQSIVTLPAQDIIVETNDGVSNRGIHLTSNSPVSVEFIKEELHASEAMVAVPTESLGTNYVVMSRFTVYKGDASQGGTMFTVVAVADDTTITISPTVNVINYPMFRNAGIPYSVTLQKGEVYHVNAWNVQAGADDLTGTTVSSTKQVALIGVCGTSSLGGSSIQPMLEMQASTDKWGMNFVVGNLSGRGSTAYRVLSSQPGTAVYVNGVLTTTLPARAWYEFWSSSPAMVVQASQPIVMAQVSAVQGQIGDTPGIGGDSAMVFVPPMERFITSVLLATPVTAGTPTHFLQVTTTTGGVGLLMVDGVVVPASSFTQAGTTGYWVANVSVTSGTHTIVANGQPVYAMAYGFGATDAYLFPGAYCLDPFPLGTLPGQTEPGGPGTINPSPPGPG